MSKTRETKLAIASVSMMASLMGCGAPAPPPSTGGGMLPASVCGRGLVVVQSDYQSTNVSLIGLDGEVISSSFLSSGSADPGLSAALSGDVSTPTARVSGEDVVLIDRYPASVITWVNIETAEVRAQLDVRTGFASNPQDYLQLDGGRAYVSRYETNATPGAEAFDEGGDLLIVDTAAPAIEGRVELRDGVADAPGTLPRASRMARVGDGVVVVLEAVSGDFSTFADSRVALIDPASDEVSDVLVLEGLRGCWGLGVESSVDPQGSATVSRLAITCNGGFSSDGSADVDHSGVAVVERQGQTLVETRRVAATDIGDRSLGAGVAFMDGGRLLLVGMGEDGGPQDALIVLDDAGEADVLMTSRDEPFSLGEVRCPAPVQSTGDVTGCGSCWVADADRGVVHRLEVGASVSVADAVVVDEAIGLPPRYLGRL